MSCCTRIYVSSAAAGIWGTEETEEVAITRDNVDEIVSYHSPSEEEVARINQLRQSAAQFIKAILVCVPGCADQTAAIRKVREALMTANAAIVLHGKV